MSTNRNNLPDLTDDVIIELAREGGFAWIPRLAGLRRFTLAEVPASQKEKIRAVLHDALPAAQEPGQPDSPGRGDQFYYRIHIHYCNTQDNRQTDWVLLIPEQSAPSELEALWRNGLDDVQTS
ncbi:conserved hypothetical protein [Dickeya chrysanthemi Ech1591]|uniref:Uncharacterized protein n=1 Tax=Dickeya chrysanthemi (strain Ech1591) TaxID=561229 RepID=C6CPE1_DICC1|nr:MULTISPECIES: protealysin inhibitor emfourin [Dickeya]ACT05996.1 conserved hypothetical protein [Dickeya chrysanthemi Ech1591]TYL43372.1 hypothetical protein FDP13_07690 [Dickeya sp. ws52]